MTPPLLTALATIGLALSTFVADEAFAMVDNVATPPIDVAAASGLRPGEFLWGADEARGRPLIIVSIPQQRLFLFQDGEIAGISTVSTGKRGHHTPTGTFQILEKRRQHFSNLYDNAPMPFMQRLTWGGVALHAGLIPGYPASHGCVRLPKGFAKLLFELTGVGASVVITETHVDVSAPLESWLPPEALATLTTERPPAEAPRAPASTTPVTGQAASTAPLPTALAPSKEMLATREE